MSNDHTSEQQHRIRSLFSRSIRLDKNSPTETSAATSTSDMNGRIFFTQSVRPNAAMIQEKSKIDEEEIQDLLSQGKKNIQSEVALFVEQAQKELAEAKYLFKESTRLHAELGNVNELVERLNQQHYQITSQLQRQLHDVDSIQHVAKSDNYELRALKQDIEQERARVLELMTRAEAKHQNTAELEQQIIQLTQTVDHSKNLAQQSLQLANQAMIECAEAKDLVLQEKMSLEKEVGDWIATAEKSQRSLFSIEAVNRQCAELKVQSEQEILAAKKYLQASLQESQNYVDESRRLHRDMQLMKQHVEILKGEFQDQRKQNQSASILVESTLAQIELAKSAALKAAKDASDSLTLVQSVRENIEKQTSDMQVMNAENQHLQIVAQEVMEKVLQKTDLQEEQRYEMQTLKSAMGEMESSIHTIFSESTQLNRRVFKLCEDADQKKLLLQHYLDSAQGFDRRLEDQLSSIKQDKQALDQFFSDARQHLKNLEESTEQACQTKIQVEHSLQSMLKDQQYWTALKCEANELINQFQQKFKTQEMQWSRVEALIEGHQQKEIILNELCEKAQSLHNKAEFFQVESQQSLQGLLSDIQILRQDVQKTHQVIESHELTNTKLSYLASEQEQLLSEQLEKSKAFQAQFSELLLQASEQRNISVALHHQVNDVLQRCEQLNAASSEDRAVDLETTRVLKAEMQHLLEQMHAQNERSKNDSDALNQVYHECVRLQVEVVDGLQKVEVRDVQLEETKRAFLSEISNHQNQLNLANQDLSQLFEKLNQLIHRSDEQLKSGFDQQEDMRLSFDILMSQMESYRHESEQMQEKINFMVRSAEKSQDTAYQLTRAVENQLAVQQQEFIAISEEVSEVSDKAKIALVIAESHASTVLGFQQKFSDMMIQSESHQQHFNELYEQMHSVLIQCESINKNIAEEKLLSQSDYQEFKDEVVQLLNQVNQQNDMTNQLSSELVRAHQFCLQLQDQIAQESRVNEGHSERLEFIQKTFLSDLLSHQSVLDAANQDLMKLFDQVNHLVLRADQQLQSSSEQKLELKNDFKQLEEKIQQQYYESEALKINIYEMFDHVQKIHLDTRDLHEKTVAQQECLHQIKDEVNDIKDHAKLVLTVSESNNQKIIEFQNRFSDLTVQAEEQRKQANLLHDMVHGMVMENTALKNQVVDRFGEERQANEVLKSEMQNLLERVAGQNAVTQSIADEMARIYHECQSLQQATLAESERGEMHSQQIDAMQQNFLDEMSQYKTQLEVTRQDLAELFYKVNELMSCASEQLNQGQQQKEAMNFLFEEKFSVLLNQAQLQESQCNALHGRADELFSKCESLNISVKDYVDTGRSEHQAFRVELADLLNKIGEQNSSTQALSHDIHHVYQECLAMQENYALSGQRDEQRAVQLESMRSYFLEALNQQKTEVNASQKELLNLFEKVNQLVQCSDEQIQVGIQQQLEMKETFHELLDQVNTYYGKAEHTQQQVEAMLAAVELTHAKAHDLTEKTEAQSIQLNQLTQDNAHFAALIEKTYSNYQQLQTKCSEDSESQAQSAEQMKNMQKNIADLLKESKDLLMLSDTQKNQFETLVKANELSQIQTQEALIGSQTLYQKSQNLHAEYTKKLSQLRDIAHHLKNQQEQYKLIVERQNAQCQSVETNVESFKQSCSVQQAEFIHSVDNKLIELNALSEMNRKTQRVVLEGLKSIRDLDEKINLNLLEHQKQQEKISEINASLFDQQQNIHQGIKEGSELRHLAGLVLTECRGLVDQGAHQKTEVDALLQQHQQKMEVYRNALDTLHFASEQALISATEMHKKTDDSMVWMQSCREEMQVICTRAEEVTSASTATHEACQTLQKQVENTHALMLEQQATVEVLSFSMNNSVQQVHSIQEELVELKSDNQKLLCSAKEILKTVSAQQEVMDRKSVSDEVQRKELQKIIDLYESMKTSSEAMFAQQQADQLVFNQQQQTSQTILAEAKNLTAINQHTQQVVLENIDQVQLFQANIHDQQALLTQQQRSITALQETLTAKHLELEHIIANSVSTQQVTASQMQKTRDLLNESHELWKKLQTVEQQFLHYSGATQEHVQQAIEVRSSCQSMYHDMDQQVQKVSAWIQKIEQKYQQTESLLNSAQAYSDSAEQNSKKWEQAKELLNAMAVHVNECLSKTQQAEQQVQQQLQQAQQVQDGSAQFQQEQVYWNGQANRQFSELREYATLVRQELESNQSMHQQVETWMQQFESKLQQVGVTAMESQQFMQALAQREQAWVKRLDQSELQHRELVLQVTELHRQLVQVKDTHQDASAPLVKQLQDAMQAMNREYQNIFTALTHEVAELKKQSLSPMTPAREPVVLKPLMESNKVHDRIKQLEQHMQLLNQHTGENSAAQLGELTRMVGGDGQRPFKSLLLSLGFILALIPAGHSLKESSTHDAPKVTQVAISSVIR